MDVRDIATAHHTLLESDLAPGRYTLGGHYVTWAELADTLGRLTGRPGIKLPLPGTAMRGVGRLVDTINRLREKPLDVPLTHEAMVYATRWVKMDDRLAETELGLNFRPLDDSLSDAIRSLVRAGHISAEMAGNLFSSEPLDPILNTLCYLVHSVYPNSRKESNHKAF